VYCITLHYTTGSPVYSADSEKTAQCAVKALHGTSMACPTAAGAAVLVRQYFVEGYYPYGQYGRNSSLGFNPSGALLKAMLVHSGTQLNRRVSSSGTSVGLEDYPSIFQGYGRIQLEDVLNFGEAEGETLSLFVRGAAFVGDKYYVQLEDDGDEDQYTFRTDATTAYPVRITMAFTDPPASNPGSSAAQIHILGLRVTNVDTGAVTSHEDAPGTAGNNVAFIEIAEPALNSTYLVTVSATRIYANQSYALVITGQVDAFTGSVNNTSAYVEIDHDVIGITSSLLAVLISLCTACLILMTVLYLVRRENARYLLLYKKATKHNTATPTTYPDDDAPA
jgi:hypothetical protein